jgi:DNA-directed RNA polymerase subunit RPC12/RpoP
MATKQARIDLLPPEAQAVISHGIQEGLSASEIFERLAPLGIIPRRVGGLAHFASYIKRRRELIRMRQQEISSESLLLETGETAVLDDDQWKTPDGHTILFAGQEAEGVLIPKEVAEVAEVAEAVVESSTSDRARQMLGVAKRVLEDATKALVFATPPRRELYVEYVCSICGYSVGRMLTESVNPDCIKCGVKGSMKRLEDSEEAMETPGVTLRVLPDGSIETNSIEAAISLSRELSRSSK